MDIKTLFNEKIQGEFKEKFQAFRALILEYNARYNLTTILEEKDMFYKHFLDSIAGAELFKKEGKVAEIGSGAGFPSIPLKIVRDDLVFDLFESVGKKCDFLQAVVDKLGFKGVHIYNIRAEDAAKRPEFREKYDHATARAVARMNTLTEYCLPFVKVGGSFIAYKSGEIEEIREAETAYKLLGGKLEKATPYALPEGYGDRVLAVVRKVKNTPPKYPRGQGKERKSPL
ncbi:MAG: 16S rRNA (guanine(527)-N(7))-methyltransferase RsmG [Clostridia bacterium]|nr:16S rRNA (guanine(527)-N(7))-methyltransferase RsmG [Clostridia bacterium]